MGIQETVAADLAFDLDSLADEGITGKSPP